MENDREAAVRAEEPPPGLVVWGMWEVPAGEAVSFGDGPVSVGGGGREEHLEEIEDIGR